MRNLRIATLMMALAFSGSVLLAALTAPEAVAQAAKAKPPKINPKVLKPLQAALQLSNEGKYAEAEEELKIADAVPNKTPFEQNQIDEMVGFTALKQKKYDPAAAAYERTLESGLVLPEQVNDRIRLLSQLFLATEPRRLDKSGKYAKQWLEATGTKDPLILGLAGQADYFADDFTGAAAYMKDAVTAAKAAGNAPDEQHLLVLQSAYAKLENRPGVVETTTELVRHYPRKEHWNTLGTSLLAQAANKDRAILQVFRFLYQVDAMDTAADFTEAANVATLLGFPGDALKFMERGYASGVLETSGDKARNQALLDESKRLVKVDQQSLAQFEKEARAGSQGEADVKLGETFLSYDQPAKGLEAIQRGLGKGGVKNPDEANLALGRALILAGNGSEAVTAFEKVTGPDYAQVAKLWAIHAAHGQD